MSEILGLDYITPPPEPVEKIVGNKKCGEVKILVRGGLTTEEEAAISELLVSEKSAYVRTAELSEVVSEKEKVKYLNEETNKFEPREISVSEAYSVITGAIFGREAEPGTEEIRLKYAAEIEEISAYWAMAGQRQKEAAVTALIRSRMGKPGWTMQHTRTLPSGLTSAIYAVFQEERGNNDEPEITPSDEELGKSSEEKQEEKPTGQKSTTT